MSTAINYPLQPLTLIKAGAGAGKTYAVQTTLANWVKDGKVQADRILAVTFTNAAASEMRNRIRVSLMKAGLIQQANLLQKSTISTMHAFGLDVLKTFAYEAGLSPAPRQLTEQEQNLLLREALDQVQAIQPLLSNLEQYGYTGGYGGGDYQEAVDQLTKTILDVIGKLRSLGKGFDASPDEARALLDQARQAIKDNYGPVQQDGTTLADDLWRAISAVTAEYPDGRELADKGEWGNNKETRQFVADVYNATRERLEQDWKLWARLQYSDQFKKIEEKHPRADLAKAVWNAAEKLAVHPGPLNDALLHVECLIQGVLDALNRYQSKKEQAGLVDYGDMVHLANVMLDNPKWLDEISNGYDCLIIDEFQDTNPLQYALLRRFQQKGIPTLIVGDLKQSIMGFQGSDSRLFDTLLKDNEQQAGIVSELDCNWRSTPELMNFINGVGNTLYGDRYQPLTPMADYHSSLPAVQALRFSKEHWNKKANARSAKPAFYSEGNTALANHIANLLKSGTEVTDRHTRQKRPIRASDIAVLARGHSRLQKFAEALRAAGIEVQIQQPGFLECESVQWLLNALQGLNNSRDQYAWLDLLTSPLINGQTSERLQALLTSYRLEFEFQHELAEQLKPLKKHLRTQPVKSQLLSIIEEAKLFDTLRTQPQGPQYRANLIKLIGLAEQFEALQPETLNAMGIAGKNAQTFQVWLSQSKDTIDTQPGADPQAENAVVLATWHASKGLEWPVVMVLDAEKASEPRFPSITMSYPKGGIDSMLQDSFVQILPQFHNEATRTRMATVLAKDEDQTNKNLYYVALTRAREQVILPFWEEYADWTMLSGIKPVIKAREEDKIPALYAEKLVTPTAAENVEQVATSSASRKGLRIIAKPQPEKLQHTISPSLAKGQEPIELPQTETTSYSPALDLDAFKGIPANEVGTWVHRLYQVYFMQPALFGKALAMSPLPLIESRFKLSIEDHLKAFKQYLCQEKKTVDGYKCEVPVTGINKNSQTVSALIDLMVTGKESLYIYEHKIDHTLGLKKHMDQLLMIKRVCDRKGSVQVNLNWISKGKVDELHEFDL